MPAVIAQMKDRLDREVPQRQAAELWSATYILMGVRYEEALIQTLLRGVIAMKESVTYQAILREGKAEGQATEARRILLLQGRSRFGEPTPETVAALNCLADVEKLEQLSMRLLQVNSWQELLGGES